jgi:2'-5' RNA ligase
LYGDVCWASNKNLRRNTVLRLFVAIEIPEPLRKAMAGLIEELRPVSAGVRWEPEEKLHVTLKFLGNTRQERLGEIMQAIEKIARRTPPFDARYAMLGTFPPKGRPRIIWVGMKEGAEEMKALAASVDAAMSGLGFDPEEHAFHPHVTIGRVKGNPNIPLLLRRMESITFECQPTRVTHIALVRSELKPSGSVYTTLKCFPLAGSGQ